MILGLIGLAIPVVPQVPFLLIGIFFLVRASNKIRSFLLDSKLFKEHVEPYVSKNKILNWIYQQMLIN